MQNFINGILITIIGDFLLDALTVIGFVLFAASSGSGAAGDILSLLFALPFLLFGTFFVGGLVIWAFVMLMVLASIVLIVLAVIDCAKRETFHSIKGENAKIIWILIILIGGIFGVIAYYFAEKKRIS
ncbi:MAG: PLDc N-terminal domain-containing protein [Candidatus Diapherotrites archaeon]|nr:PLDc N-terminal domain-containing protein [Candidatus Diapherotrites archaeon]